MAPLRLLAALLAAHFQLSFGQQINEGNNLIAVASHKLAAIKQQSQKQNVTDTEQTTDSEDNLDLKNDELVQVNLNTSTLYPVGGTLTSIKFVKNPAYDRSSFPTMISKDAADPISVSYDPTFFNLTNTSPNDSQLNNGAGQAENQPREDTIGFVGKSPILISFTPRCAGAMPSQSPYFISALPTQSSLSNMITLQSPAASPVKQQSTFSSAQFQPSNVQSPANMQLRFVPVPTTVPIQSTGPARTALPVQSTEPIHNKVSVQSAVPLHSIVPIQTTAPTQNSVPIQNTLPIQSTVPIQNTVPIKNSAPIQNTVPIQNTAPIQNTVPIQNSVPIQNAIMMQRTTPVQRTEPVQNSIPTQRTVPMQNSIDNIMQNPHLSVLLPHLLSQNYIKQDYSAPTNSRYANQDQQQPSKQTAVKTLLPILLQLLTEKNNNCCELKNKKDRSRTYSRYKYGNKKAYDTSDADFGTLFDTAHYARRVNENKRFKKPADVTLEDEDYSNESFDYSAEEYDDED